MKQQIEIDVPDEYDIHTIDESDLQNRLLTGEPCMTVSILLKKKEPEFIEVRNYLAMCGKNLTVGATVIGCPKHSQPEEIEKYGNFVRWIDKEPRRVEI